MKRNAQNDGYAISDADAANKMLDQIKVKLSLKNDSALSRALEVMPSVLSKIRHQKINISADMLIRVHELTGWPIRKLKQDLGLSSLKNQYLAA